MAKGGRSSSSSRSGGGSILSSDNNNFLGSLLGSLTFGFFDVHKCDAEDNTWYCKFSRFFGALMKVIFLAIIFYVGYVIFFRGNRLSGGKVGIKRK
tara:strand:- start:16536 stop:16823 length:288 start_codon:yes stop_codon:yes gene_type:complete